MMIVLLSGHPLVQDSLTHLVILDGNNTIRTLQPFLSLGKDTVRLNPKLSTSPIARTTNLVGQTKKDNSKRLAKITQST